MATPGHEFRKRTNGEQKQIAKKTKAALTNRREKRIKSERKIKASKEGSINIRGKGFTFEGVKFHETNRWVKRIGKPLGEMWGA